VAKSSFPMAGNIYTRGVNETPTYFQKKKKEKNAGDLFFFPLGGQNLTTSELIQANRRMQLFFIQYFFLGPTELLRDE